MKHQDISNIVMEKIKKDKIKPKAKWEFLLKNYVFWGAFILCIIIGAIASSLIIFHLVNNDWDIYEKLGKNLFSFTAETIPYFWLIVMVFFIFIADYNFKHTDKGYRYQLPFIIIGSITISIILGFALFGIGVAKKIDANAMNNIPLYRNHLIHPRMEMWNHQEKGLAAGKILEIDETHLKIRTFNNEELVIEVLTLPQVLKNFHEGEVIGIKGHWTEENKLEAEAIRPWKGNVFKEKPPIHPPMKKINLKENSKHFRII